VALAVVYIVLTRVMFRVGVAELPGMAELIARERASLGALSRGEAIAGAVFVVTAAGWILQPVLARAVPMVSDTTIAIAGALSLLVIPVNRARGEFVMTWDDTRGLPWGVLLLFGGGLSLAG